METNEPNILNVRDLNVQVRTREGLTTLVQDINFGIKKGKFLVLLGKAVVVKPLQVCLSYSYILKKT